MTEVPGVAPVDVDALRQHRYFDRLPDGILRKLAPHVARQDVAAGDRILRRGDYNDAAWFVLGGRVHVLVPRADGGTAVEAVPLDEGEIFGEMGALSRYPVSADVVAATAATLLRVGTPALRLMRKQQALADFAAFIDERYRSRSLASHLRQLALLEGLDDATLDALTRAAELRSFEPGETIVEEGAPDEALYLVRGGYVKVSVATPAAPGHAAVTYLRRDDHAGGAGLAGGGTWPCTLSALEHVEIVRIPRDALAPVLTAHPGVTARLAEAARAREAEYARVRLDPAASRPLEMAMDRGLINGQSVLLIDMSTCTGCDDCVRACADTHDGRPRFVRQGSRFRQWQVPLACYQCTDPVCMIGCPTGAITRPQGDVTVAIDDATCIGCGNCASRCPWDNLLTVPYEHPGLGRTIALATKCDACHGRPEGPACVQMCPHGSAVRLSFQDREAVTRIFGAPAGVDG